MERDTITIPSGQYWGDTAKLKRGIVIGGQSGDTLTIIDQRTLVEHEYFLVGSDTVLEIAQALQLTSGPTPAFPVSHRSGMTLGEVPPSEAAEILRIRSLFEDRPPSELR